jgi:hypothetical protein
MAATSPSADTPMVPRLARAVLAGFLRNPRATDSLEGVARWRVHEETIHQTVEEVSQALGWLVEHGFLMREAAEGTPPLFRLNVGRSTEAERLLADGDGVAPRPGPLLTLALTWIDAVLLRHHRQNPPAQDDLPGFSRSSASVESALLPRVASGPTPADETQRSAERAWRALREALAAADRRQPLALLYNELGLTPLELQALLLCLAPELDRKYQTIYGVLHDDLGRRAATLGLVCALLGDPLAVRDGLARADGLLRWRLLEPGARWPYADESLRLDAVIVDWLLGKPDALLCDPRLAPLLRRQPWPGAGWLRLPADRAAVAELSELLSGSGNAAVRIALHGEDAGGWRALIEAAAVSAGTPLLRIVPSPEVSGDPDDLATRVTRAARLGGAVPVLDAGATDPGRLTVEHLLSALAAGEGPLVLVASEVARVIGQLPAEPWQLRQRPAPDGAALAAVYAAAAAETQLELTDSEAEQLALTFPLGLGAIEDAFRLAVLQGAAQALPAERRRLLAAACRQIAAPDLPRFARRIEPAFQLEQVVVPPDQQAQLEEIVAHVSCAAQVLQGWGFRAQLPYGRGVAALFSGPSGTGKTMAAQAIARSLHTQVYQVDLSRVVSKYIGESEKNLDAVFTDAERAGAVLLFDEADALFGKRSEIKDAHDRYANIEVAYLLQRIEAFGGLAVLTTNFRQNLDQAFLRRLRFVIDFPRPDARAREAIWRQCLPPTAPVQPDVDVRFLARRIELTGGNIRQITLRAAFAAAQDRVQAIGMVHLLKATRAELRKLGMPTAERELTEIEQAHQRGFSPEQAA